VAPASSESSSSATDVRSARLLGVGSTIVVLALACLSALGIADLAHGHFETGLWDLVAVIALRWSLGTLLDEWGESAAVRVRTLWRRRLVGHLAVPRSEGERGRGDLALAIDHAADAPSLERLGASAASSVVGIIVVFIAAGWLPFVITVALLGVAVPLYQRAGRRSEVMAVQYQERRASLEARQLEVLQHAPELRALGAVTYGANEIAAISDSEHSLALRAIRVALESSLVTEFLSGVSIGLVAMVVGFGLLGGRISLLRALIAVLVTSGLFFQVRRFGVEFHRRDDAQRARQLLESLARAPRHLSNDDLLVVEDLVTEAHYERLSLRVRRGDRIIITGPSGIGKTTLLHTLLDWRSAKSGETHRSDEPVGYVSVESSLLSGSLRENLTLGSAATDSDLFSRLASLGLVGERFEDLDVQLLSDGRGMSSGERVRLVLARALLQGSTLLVLDDVAGVLDADARDDVRHALDELSDVAVIEATVDTPLLMTASRRIELRP
jgi:ABC-type transport system involved in cytochrome bd biosynthesis fused ATPase/permease subunit